MSEEIKGTDMLTLAPVDKYVILVDISCSINLLGTSNDFLPIN